MLEMFKVNEICSIDNVIIDAVVTYKTICDAECIVANQRLKCCGIHSMHPYAQATIMRSPLQEKSLIKDVHMMMMMR